MNLRSFTHRSLSSNTTINSTTSDISELPENPIYSTLILIGIAITASCACYCCTSKIILEKDLFLGSIKDHVNLIGKTTESATEEAL